MEGITDANYSHVEKVKKNSGWVSWLVRSEWYIITCKCVWKL